jgi:NADH dehydrogenase
LALAATRLAGMVLRDLVLTADEVAGLRAGLLTSSAAPAGRTRFADWLRPAAPTLGRCYRSELARHYAG